MLRDRNSNVIIYEGGGGEGGEGGRGDFGEGKPGNHATTVSVTLHILQGSDNASTKQLNARILDLRAKCYTTPTLLHAGLWHLFDDFIHRIGHVFEEVIEATPPTPSCGGRRAWSQLKNT